MTCSLAQTSLVRIYRRRANCGAFISYCHIGHWLFTQLLLPALFAATDASPSHEKARIVTVSSVAGYLTDSLDFDAFVDSPGRTKYTSGVLYNKSKYVRRTESFQPFSMTDLAAGQRCCGTRACAAVRRQDRVHQSPSRSHSH